jgi:hypothetical protein
MKTDYDKMRPLLDTFDVVLFKGKGLWSFLIGLFSKKYTHVGLIWKCSQSELEQIKQNEKLVWRIKWKQHFEPYARRDGVILVFESTLLNGVKGVQLNLLSEHIKNYNGSISLRQFIHDRTDKERKTFADFISKTLGLPYEKDPLELLGGAVKFGPEKSDEDDYFCSELNAKAYQLCKFLPEKPCANKYAPEDFGNGKISDNLIAGAFGEIFRIK